MTKKDYYLIAFIINRACKDLMIKEGLKGKTTKEALNKAIPPVRKAIDKIINEFSDVLQGTNPRFDKNKFLEEVYNSDIERLNKLSGK